MYLNVFECIEVSVIYWLFSRCVPSRSCNRCLDPVTVPPGYASWKTCRREREP